MRRQHLGRHDPFGPLRAPAALDNRQRVLLISQGVIQTSVAT